MKLGKAVGMGVSVVWLLFILGSFVFSIVVKNTELTEKSLSVVLLIVSLASMFVGGFLTGWQGKEKGWLLGGIVAVVVIFIIFLIQFLGFDWGVKNGQLIYYGAFFLVSVIGGIMGVNFSNGRE